MEQEMKYIWSVYKNGSFSKAAEELYITQPALSLAVKRTEEKIGAQIFDRSSKKLQLTEAGELYIRKYREIRDLETELEKQLNDLSSLKAGSLTIGGTNYFNSYILPRVIVAYQKKYPGIHLHLQEAGSHVLVDLLKEHRIDIAFHAGLSSKDPFYRIPCFEDRVLLSVPKTFDLPESLRNAAMTNKDIMNLKHLDDHVPSVKLSSFVHLPFILLSPGNNLYERSTKMFAEENLEPKVVMQVNQLATAWHLSCAGLGIAFISDHLVTSSSEDVLFFKPDSDLTARKFEMIMSENHYISKAMKAFYEVFIECYPYTLNKHPYVF